MEFCSNPFQYLLSGNQVTKRAKNSHNSKKLITTCKMSDDDEYTEGEDEEFQGPRLGVIGFIKIRRSNS
jgi:enoyl reductase-like protein